MKEVKDYDCIDIAIAIYHRLNSLYGLGMMLEENEIDEDEFIEEIEDVLSDILQGDRFMNFIEKNKAIMKIADTFGPKNQRLKLIEELSELIKELSLDVAYDRQITQNTIDEIADVLILIDQVLYLEEKNGLNAQQLLDSAIEYKIYRTLKRIASNYYE